MTKRTFTFTELNAPSTSDVMSSAEVFNDDLLSANNKGLTLVGAKKDSLIEWQVLEVVNTGFSLIATGQGINYGLLSQLIEELNSDLQIVECSPNPYHMRYGKQVINLRFAEQSTAPKQAELLKIAQRYNVDLYLKPSNTSLDRPGLLVMDMDSTIIDIECIDEIGALANVKDKIAAVTEQAMRGEIAFTDSLKYRVACLAGVELDKLSSIRRRLPFMPGFLATMQELKKHGWYLAIASGGFTYFADYVKALAGLNEAHSNVLEIDKGLLTGKVIGDIVDGEKKAQVLKQLQSSQNIAAHQTVAMGDGANDLIMMAAADLGVAYHAKPKVQEQAHVAINTGSFESLLYILA
ncbi:phosphoserine phosphatase SerB [Agaribacter flavus]|uniref:Phosphoserine phosphatase n=1 Tax=Agaribacter flavus TaxID=1902781 RepID=A0ABV7FTQ6_9ALTE